LIRTAFSDAKTNSAAYRSSQGRAGSVQLDCLEVRAKRHVLPLETREVPCFVVEIRGRLSTQFEVNAVSVLSLVDVTGEESHPVISTLEDQQEQDSRVFQERKKIGRLPQDAYLDEWTHVGLVIPEALITPFSGARRLSAVVRIMPESQVEQIGLGFHQESTRVLMMAHCQFPVTIEEVGYIEARERHQEALEIIVRTAVAMAAKDNGIQREEATIIKRWMKEQVASVSHRHQDDLKERLNAALKEAHTTALSGSLIIEPLVDKLASFALPSANRQLLDLLSEVAGADSELAAAELEMIRDVGRRLGISQSEVEALSEARFLASGVQISTDTSGESLLGIDPSWSHEQIRTHLRKEFAKWNGRIQALSTDEEREKAQSMIDLIAELRQKYS
jgi:uncharacterized tellurite resistance protein B-like protein